MYGIKELRSKPNPVALSVIPSFRRFVLPSHMHTGKARGSHGKGTGKGTGKAQGRHGEGTGKARKRHVNLFEIIFI